MDITVIIPIYNEEGNIDLMYKALKDAFYGIDRHVEFIFINDGSRDGSLAGLKKIIQIDSLVRIISFDKNYGKTSALDAGFRSAKGGFVLTIDGDLQYNPKDLLRIIKELDSGADIVLGRRVNRTSGLLKNISSKAAIFIRNLALGEGYQECYLAGYKKAMLKELVLYSGFQDFIPALLKDKKRIIKEIEVKEYPRRYGRSKYCVMNRVFKAFFTLLAVKWMKNNKMRYRIVD